MSERGVFERFLESLHRSALDDTHWLETSHLLTRACETTSISLLAAGASEQAAPLSFLGCFQEGRRRTDAEREYVEIYHSTNEGLADFRQLPFGRVQPLAGLFTEDELETSATYNDYFRRYGCQGGLAVRMEGRGGDAHLGWFLGDPVGSEGWSGDRIRMIERLTPHVRCFVWVRQALIAADAVESSLADLLENRRIGVIQLDRGGRLLAANDRASAVLKRGDVLGYTCGALRVRSPADEASLRRLLVGALAPGGESPVGGSAVLGSYAPQGQLTVHVRPAIKRETAFGGQDLAALLLVVESGSQPRVEPELAAAALGLTASEGLVAASIASGRTVREIALSTRRKESTIYWHLRQIYAKLNISRQSELIRLVLGLGDFESARPSES